MVKRVYEKRPTLRLGKLSLPGRWAFGQFKIGIDIILGW